MEALAERQFFDELGSKLNSLQKILSDNGKELYVLITPSKARFCEDKIPIFQNAIVQNIGCFVLWVASVLYLVGLSYNPFIYFKF